MKTLFLLTSIFFSQLLFSQNMISKSQTHMILNESTKKYEKYLTTNNECKIIVTDINTKGQVKIICGENVTIFYSCKFVEDNSIPENVYVIYSKDIDNNLNILIYDGVHITFKVNNMKSMIIYSIHAFE